MRPANVNKTKDTARPQGWTKTRDRCCKVSNNARDGRTDGQTYRQTDRQSATQYAAPSLRRRAA